MMNGIFGVTQVNMNDKAEGENNMSGIKEGNR